MSDGVFKDVARGALAGMIASVVQAAIGASQSAAFTYEGLRNGR
jgi:hypothetical protein